MPDPNIALGTTVVTARAARRWTQDDLAARIGVARQAIARWETGHTPSDANLAKLREVLGPDVWTVPDRPVQRFAASDVRGVRIAALRMSEVLTALLRECAEVEDAAETAAREALAAQAIATTRAAARAATSAASDTQAPRRRRG